MATLNTSHIIRSALAKLLKPIVRLMIKHNVPLGSFLEVLKHVYVVVAKEELTLPGKKLSDSRIAVVTGLPRKDVKNHSQLPEIEDQNIVREHNRAARVLTGWIQDSFFHDSKGKPMDLPLESENEKPSFHNLVLKYSGGVPTRAILDELTRVDAIRNLENGEIRLVSFGYIPNRGELEQVEMVSREISDFLYTIDHNITHDVEDSYLQLSARCDNLPEEIMEKIRHLGRDKGQQLLQEFLSYMSHYDRDQNDNVFGTGRKRAVYGIYYYEEDVEQEVEDEEK
jgi:hypothetical protein